MKPTVSVGLLLFVIIPREGTCGQLNLEEEVKKYILSYIGTGLVDFSLKDRPVAGNVPAVSAKVEKLTYESGCEHKQFSAKKECSHYYIWYIYNSTSTPFRLPVNLTVLHEGQRNNIYNADINNATLAYWNPQNLSMPLDEKAMDSEVKCHFSIELSFKGTFVYQVESAQDDKATKGHHYIGRVALNNPKQLAQRGDEVLVYNIGGVHIHQMFCHSTLKPKKPE
uniref:Da-p36 protein n=1 Tax=Hyalomma excavatum TaxID=257692 RepID=A0A131XLE5_9ACAR